MKRLVVFLVTSTMLIMALSGCQTTPSPSSSAVSSQAADDFSETGTLFLDWGSSVGTDSVFECPWADMQSLYESMVFDTLIKLEMDGATMVPALAKSWEVSTDALTYTFTLNEGVKWHDGTAFTAEDIVFTYNTVLKVPESYYKSYLSAIAGVQDVIDGKAQTATGIVANGNTITFTLTVPDSSIVATFASLCVLPSHLLKTVDPTLFTKNEAFWKKPVGTGSYKIDEVSFPNFFTVVRNDDYFGEKANIKTVLFTSYVTGGVESIRADVIAGKIDFAFGNAVNDITNAKNIIEQNTDIKMVIVPSTYQRQLWFNNVGSTDDKYNALMQKPEVRQALSLLLDKEALASFYKGQGVPLTTFVNPDLAAYNSDIPLFKRDVEKAKEMLTAAGFDFTKTLRLLYYYDDQTTKDFMEVIKQNFADAGVKLEPFLATGDLAALIYTTKNWDIMYAGAGNQDPILIYKNLVPDDGIVDGLFGDVEYRRNLFGTLMAEYNATTDPTEKNKIGDQIQLEGSKYSLVVPIYGLNKVVLFNEAKLKLPEGILDADLLAGCDLHFDQWELLK